jgi:hypothetical protein
VLAAGE